MASHPPAGSPSWPGGLHGPKGTRRTMDIWLVWAILHRAASLRVNSIALRSVPQLLMYGSTAIPDPRSIALCRVPAVVRLIRLSGRFCIALRRVPAVVRLIRLSGRFCIALRRVPAVVRLIRLVWAILHRAASRAGRRAAMSTVRP